MSPCDSQPWSDVSTVLRLLVVGALTIVASVMIQRAVTVDRGDAPSSSEPISRGQDVVPIDRRPSSVGPVETDAPSHEQTPKASVDGLRIAIPRLGIDLPLDVGDIGRDVPRPDYSGATPEGVAWLFPGSNVPGRSGNSYVYAHARSGMFLALWSVRLDDVVLVLRSDRSVLRTYRIALVVPRVDPLDTHWLDSGGRERLTLQTSTGPRPMDPRFIAVAYPVE